MTSPSVETTMQKLSAALQSISSKTGNQSEFTQLKEQIAESRNPAYVKPLAALAEKIYAENPSMLLFSVALLQVAEQLPDVGQKNYSVIFEAAGRVLKRVDERPVEGTMGTLAYILDSYEGLLAHIFETPRAYAVKEATVDAILRNVERLPRNRRAYTLRNPDLEAASNDRQYKQMTDMLKELANGTPVKPGAQNNIA